MSHDLRYRVSSSWIIWTLDDCENDELESKQTERSTSSLCPGGVVRLKEEAAVLSRNYTERGETLTDDYFVLLLLLFLLSTGSRLGRTSTA